MNKKDTSEVKWIEGKKFYLLTVEKGETMYSLSKRFNITQDELILHNPELKYGLRVKMKLRIPATPLPAEAEPELQPIPAKTLFRVALVLPLALWKNFLPQYTIPDSTGAVSIVEETIPHLEFYEGALMASEAMSSSEFKIHLYEFDSSNDTARVAAYLADPDMKKMDYIVVAGSPQVLRQVNRFSIQTNIPLLTFVLNASEVIRNNPNAYIFNPSSTLQCYEAGKILAGRFKENMNGIAVKSGIAKETERSQAFQKGWNENSESKMKLLDLSKNLDAIYPVLSKEKNNVVFVPSSNEDFVSALGNKLEDTLSTYRVTLVGIPTWQYFETIDAGMFEKLNTHLFSSSGILAQESQSLTGFKDRYANEYSRPPSDAAIHGFDAIGFVDHRRKEGGTVFNGLFAGYEFIPSGINENNTIYIYKYQNYELVEVK